MEIFFSEGIDKIVLYDSRLFNRTDHVGRWAASVARNFEGFAKAAAPVNKRPNKSHWDRAYPPGSLKAGIQVGAERIGPRHIQVVLSTHVPYAKYVIKGTHGPITATTADYMTLPRNPGFGRGRRHFTVSGQHPNNFLSRAAAMTAARHPSLRGLDHLLYQQW